MKAHSIVPSPSGRRCEVCDRPIRLVSLEAGDPVAGLGPDGPDVRRPMKRFWVHG